MAVNKAVITPDLEGCRALLFTRSGSAIVLDPRLQTEYLDAFYAFSLKFHDMRLYSASQTARFLEPLEGEEAEAALTAYRDWLLTNAHRKLVKQVLVGEPFVADQAFDGRPPLPALAQLHKANEDESEPAQTAFQSIRGVLTTETETDEDVDLDFVDALLGPEDDDADVLDEDPEEDVRW